MDDRRYEKWVAINEILETHRDTNASNRFLADRVLERLEEFDELDEKERKSEAGLG